MVKSPRPMRKEQTTSRFKEYVEALEESLRLLRSSSSASTRIGLVALDSIIDSLLFRACEEVFALEEGMMWIQPPSYSQEKRSEILWSLHKKNDLLEERGVLTGEETALIAFVHSYRNPAVHRDRHNSAVSPVIASFGFPPCFTLLSHLFSGTSIYFGESRVEWLSRYDLPVDHLDYTEAIEAIRFQMTKETTIPLGQAGTILGEDLQGRLAAIHTIVDNELGNPSDKKLAVILSQEEFAHSFDEEQESEDLRIARYSVVNGSPPSHEQYKKLEDEYQERVKRSFETFEPRLTSERLKEIESSIAAIGTSESPAGLVEAYSGLDKEMRDFEMIIDNASNRLDYEIQHQADLARRK